MECVAMPRMMAMPLAAIAHVTASSPGAEPSHAMCCSETKKDGAPAKCPKESKESNCCLDCPMCYTTIMPCTNEVSVVVLVFKKLYRKFQSSYAFGYAADTWKPPNQA